MKLLAQIAIVFGICLIGEVIAGFLPIPIPASIISMVLLLILLFVRIIKIEHIREKADFLLQNMAFFFIPAGVSILENYQYLQDAIIPFLIICFVTTFLTFAATSLTVKAVLYLQERWGKKE
jgi:holin-like protein